MALSAGDTGVGQVRVGDRLVQLGMSARHPRLRPFYCANFIQSGTWATLHNTRR